MPKWGSTVRPPSMKPLGVPKTPKGPAVPKPPAFNAAPQVQAAAAVKLGKPFGKSRKR